MNVNSILLIIALVLAIIAALLGFEVFDTDGDPHVAGYLSASLAFYFAHCLAGPYISRRE